MKKLLAVMHFKNGRLVKQKINGELANPDKSVDTTLENKKENIDSGQAIKKCS